MSTFRGSAWELDLPVGWSADSDDTCTTIQGLRRTGALQISGAQKDGEVTDDDLRDFASEHLDAGARPSAEIYGDYAGFSLKYGEDGTYWRYWYLRRSRSMLLVTYNCPEEDRGSEEADVDRILGTLRWRRDG